MLIAITFDDGYLSQLRFAKLLKQLGIKATFFIVTHLKTFEGKTLLTINEELIAELSEMGHEIGSHTATHRVLTDLDTSKLREELKISKKYLEDITGKEVLGFAYPYGIYNLRAIREVSRYYYYARATDILPLEDPLNMRVLSRYTIGSVSIKTLSKMILYAINPTLSSYIKPTIFIHDINAPKWAILRLMIHILQKANAKFLSMKELVEIIEKEH
jgi:peptidoglycan/xylan/chitin deacetylase (PgdA/CDA1 family)